MTVMARWNWELVLELLPYLLGGLRFTFIVAVVTMSVGLVLGLAIALGRVTGPTWLSLPAAVFVDIFRGTPVLTQLLFFYITVPLTTGFVLSALNTALVAFSLNVAAYCAEIFRSGINSIGSQQLSAALALGMSRPMAYRRVIVPQAIRRVIPPLGNIWVSLFKDSSLVALISVPDVLFRGREMAGIHYRTFELYTAVAVIYFLVSLPQAKVVDWLHARYQVQE